MKHSEADGTPGLIIARLNALALFPERSHSRRFSFVKLWPVRKGLRIVGIGAVILLLSFAAAVILVLVDQKGGRPGLLILLVVLLPLWLWLLMRAGRRRKDQ